MPNFEDLAAEEKTKLVQIYILSSWNYEQEQIFKSGGISMPKFESYDDLIKFQEVMKKSFPPANIKFSDYNPMGSENIGDSVTFDLPPKFKIENENA